MRKVTVRIPENLYFKMKKMVEEEKAESISAIVRDSLEYIIEKYSRVLEEG